MRIKSSFGKGLDYGDVQQNVGDLPMIEKGGRGGSERGKWEELGRGGSRNATFCSYANEVYNNIKKKSSQYQVFVTAGDKASPRTSASQAPPPHSN